MATTCDLIDHLIGLSEGVCVGDDRTDKGHYLVAKVRRTSHPKYSNKDFSRDRGEFVLVPYTKSYSTAWEKSHPEHKEPDEELDPSDEDFGKSYATKPWANRRISGQFEVNHEGRFISFDLEPVEDYRTRRLAYSSSGIQARSAYTIHKIGDERLNRPLTIKLLADVAKIDPAILAFSIKGTQATVQDFINQKRGKLPHDTWSTSTTGELVCYHGTSTTRWKTIQVKGLMPGQTSFAGEPYGDQVPGYTDKNVYLSTSIDAAANYGTRMAQADKSRAIVLRVIVRDLTKFVPDEDSLWWMDMMAGGPEFLKRTGIPNFHFKHTEWKSSPHAKEIEKIFMAQTKQSLKNGCVAYRGRIPAKDISVELSYKPQRMFRDPGHEEYTAAMDKTAASVKRHESIAQEVIRALIS